MLWKMEGKNTWSHLPFQTDCIPQAVTLAAAQHQHCISHPEWPSNKAYPSAQMEETTLVAFRPYI